MEVSYKHMGIDLLTDFAQQEKGDQNKEGYSLGDLLYSSLREKNTGIKIEGLYKVTELSDQNIYEAIEKAMKDERGN